MQKIAIHRPGGYERLQIETHPSPKRGPGEVRVRVQAIGVNYADVCIRWGVYESAKKFVGWPITPGFEFAGWVEELGPGITGQDIERLKPGTPVVGITQFNAYATEVVVPSYQLFAIPKGWTLAQAAGFPAVFMTAYHALFQSMRVRPGMNFLVHSAAGGVGGALLQLSRIAGCRAVGVVGSSHKVDAAKAFGAEVVIDKSREDLWKAAEAAAPAGYDAVFDANGPTTLRESYRHVRPTGRLVTYGFHSMLPRARAGGGGRMNYLKAAAGLLRVPKFNPIAMTNENRGVIAFNLSFLFERRDLLDEGMGDLLNWANEGKLHPPQVTTYPFKDVAKAHAAIESGKTVGKLVLLTDQSEG